MSSQDHGRIISGLFDFAFFTNLARVVDRPSSHRTGCMLTGVPSGSARSDVDPRVILRIFTARTTAWNSDSA